jgi:outer membrane protein TolC
MKNIILYIILGLIFVSVPLAAQNIKLDSAKVLALENNKRIKDAQYKLKASEKVKESAFTNYFPKVSASAFAVRSSDYLLDIQTPEMNLPVYDGNPANIGTATQFAYVPPLSIQSLDYANTAVVTAIQPLYAGGQIKNGNKLANLGEEINQLQLNLTTDQVLTTTESYYWQLVALKEKQSTLESYKKLLLTLQKEVQDFFDAGLVNKSDLLKVKLELNKIEVNKLKLDNGTEMLKMVFSQYIGIPYNKTMSLNDSIVSLLPPESYFVETKMALANRQEYKMLNKAVEAEVLQKKMTKGEYLPQLAVGVGGLYLDAYEQDNSYGLAFATLSIPISDWWGGSYKLQEHEIKIKIAQNNLEEKSELLQLQISKAYKDLIISYKQINIAKTSLKQSFEYQKELEDTFDAGLTSTSDLLEARALTQQAKETLIDAKSQYKIMAANYLLVVGRISQ